MYTIQDYLDSLKNDKNNLVDNLEAKGISGLTGEETFTELVPEVLNISQGDLSEYFTDTIGAGDQYFSGIAKMIKTIPSSTTVLGTDLQYGFARFSGTENEIPLLDTSNVINMEGLFYICNNITTIPLFNTSNATSMVKMFYNCENLTSIPLLNTINVTNMSGMFYNCRNLVTIPLLNTSNVNNMSEMFSYDPNLTSIPLLDTSNVTTFYNMFNGCQNLVTIPLLDTTNINNISGMFSSSGANLSNESLDNILQMFINASSYTGTKTLYQAGFRSTRIPSSRIQALPHYQDFINAGWTIGY